MTSSTAAPVPFKTNTSDRIMPSETMSPCPAEGTSGARHDEGDLENDVRVLLEAIHLAARLASMDANDYEKALWRPDAAQQLLQGSASTSTPSLDSDGPSSSKECGVPFTPRHALLDIRAMEREYDLETHTDLPRLVRSICRLHSNQCCLQEELEASEARANKLQSQLDELHQRHQRLGDTHHRLHGELSKARHDKRILKEAVRQYQATNASQQRRLETLLQVNEVLHLWVHEDHLAMRGSPKRPRFVASRRIGEEDVSPTSQVACSKTKYRPDDDEDETEATEASTVTPPTTPRRSTFQADWSDESDDARSLPSFIHTVSDDGIAVLRFPSPGDACRVPPPTPPHAYNNDASMSSLDDCSSTASQSSPCASPLPWTSSPTPSPSEAAPYTLTYEMGTKMGLRVRPVELEAGATAAPTTLTDRRPLISTESLIVTPPHAVRNASLDSIPTTGEPSADTEHGSRSAEDVGSKSFSIGSILGKKKPSPQSAPPRQAFVVCGYTEADYASISSPSSFRRVAPPGKPPIGARIVAINGRPVRDSWTFAQFLDHMKQAEGSRAAAASQQPGGDTLFQAAHGVSPESSFKYYFTVTFRNDDRTDRQREHLAVPSRGAPCTSATPQAAPLTPFNAAASPRGDQAAPNQGTMDSLPDATSKHELAPAPATTPNPSLLGSISSSFWGKAAEMYAS